MSKRDFLAEMAQRSRERVKQARAAEREAALRARALDTPVPSAPVFGSFDVIAELKLRSPAAGNLQDRSFDRRGLIEAYARGGACAVSVLTEPTQFHGQLEDLREAASGLHGFGIPAMRKDFLTDPYQLLEARAAGAGGALVIVTMLEDALVEEMLECARELDLFVLLEGFDTHDLQRIAQLSDGADPTRVLAGVNCRDLRTLQVEIARFEALAADLPDRLRCVAESGIASTENVGAAARQGYRAALIGSALMSANEPEATLRSFIAAGRAAVDTSGAK